MTDFRTLTTIKLEQKLWTKETQKQNIKKTKSAPSSAPFVVGYQLEDAKTIMPHTTPLEQLRCTDQRSAALLGLFHHWPWISTGVGRSHLRNPKQQTNLWLKLNQTELKASQRKSQKCKRWIHLFHQSVWLIWECKGKWRRWFESTLTALNLYPSLIVFASVHHKQ